MAIEELIADSLKGLCVTCRHTADCIYHRQSTRAIIQCELFEPETIEDPHVVALGLCNTCDHAATCMLPGRITGVWHCNEFE